jgi:inorganic pyrophosphatase
MHPWHDIEAGDSPPRLLNALIEIPKGSKAKYEICKTTGLLKLDRVIYGAMHYPINYGFVPQTLCGDGDPLDILVLSQIALEPRSLVAATPIAVMRMYDKGEDDKIIAVCANDISVAHIDHIDKLPPHLYQEILHFFRHYKNLEQKITLIEGIQGIEIAHKIIVDNMAAYQQKFRK